MRSSDSYLLNGDVDTDGERGLIGILVGLGVVLRFVLGGGLGTLSLTVGVVVLVHLGGVGHGVKVGDGEHHTDSLFTELADKFNLLNTSLVDDLELRGLEELLDGSGNLIETLNLGLQLVLSLELKSKLLIDCRILLAQFGQDNDGYNTKSSAVENAVSGGEAGNARLADK
jgi:hypothetical protein